MLMDLQVDTDGSGQIEFDEWAVMFGAAEPDPGACARARACARVRLRVRLCGLGSSPLAHGRRDWARLPQECRLLSLQSAADVVIPSPPACAYAADFAPRAAACVVCEEDRRLSARVCAQRATWRTTHICGVLRPCLLRAARCPLVVVRWLMQRGLLHGADSDSEASGSTQRSSVASSSTGSTSRAPSYRGDMQTPNIQRATRSIRDATRRSQLFLHAAWVPHDSLPVVCARCTLHRHAAISKQPRHSGDCAQLRSAD